MASQFLLDLAALAFGALVGLVFIAGLLAGDR